MAVFEALKNFTGVSFVDSHPFNYSVVNEAKIHCLKGLSILVLKWAGCMFGASLAGIDFKWYRLRPWTVGNEAPSVTFGSVM